MKHIGFTGTRRGMTPAQRHAVDQEVCDFIAGDVTARVVAHHGDCVGADADFHGFTRQYGFAVCVHPPIDKTHAANTREATHVDGTKIVRLDAKPYLDRNKDIVDSSDVMLATPAETTEQQRGGTWSTIRYARKQGKPLAIVWPDGRVSYERWP